MLLILVIIFSGKKVFTEWSHFWCLAPKYQTMGIVYSTTNALDYYTTLYKTAVNIVQAPGMANSDDRTRQQNDKNCFGQGN